MAKILTGILSIILFSCINALAQQTTRNYFLEGRYHYGKILKHSPKIDPLVKGPVTELEASLVIQTIGKHKWAELYRYPEMGFGYHHTFFNNPEILGYAFTLNGFMRVPVIQLTWFEGFYHIGMGPCYINKTYDDDPINLAIGSHANMYLYTGAETKFKLGKRFSLVAAYGINHYSIGNLTQPNVGLNVVSASLALDYQISNNHPVEFNHIWEMPKKKNEFWFYYGPGYKEIDLDMGHKYFTSTLSANYARRVTIKRKIGLGISLFYDESLRTTMKDEGFEDINQTDMFRSGVNISHELLFVDLSFVTQFGHYIYSRSNRYDRFYYRVGFKYHFNNLFAMLSLKAHPPAIADFVEWSIGYRFNY